jgi:DNA-binding MarR family transcriptional regulator
MRRLAGVLGAAASRPRLAPLAVIARLARVRSHIDAELESVFREFGLSQPDFEALLTLARISDKAHVSQRRLPTSSAHPGAISVRVDRLPDQGLVQRSTDPASKRRAHRANPRGQGAIRARRRQRAALAGRALQRRAHPTRRSPPQAQHRVRRLAPCRSRHPPPARSRPDTSPCHDRHARRRRAYPRSPACSSDPSSPTHQRPTPTFSPATSSPAPGRELRSTASLYAAIRDARDGTIPLGFLRGSDQLRTILTLDPSCSTNGHAAAPCGPRRRAEHTI